MGDPKIASTTTTLNAKPDKDVALPRKNKSSTKTKATTDSSVSGTTTASSSTTSTPSEARRDSISEKIKRVSEDHPPAKNPLGYSAAVIAALCCAGCAVCMIILIFCFLQLIPMAAVIVGAVYANQNRYCPAADIPTLLIVGGVLQTLQVILSEAFTVHTTIKKLAMIEIDTEAEGSLDASSSNKSTMTTSCSKLEGGVAEVPPIRTNSSNQENEKGHSVKSRSVSVAFLPNASSTQPTTKMAVEIVVVEKRRDNLGTYFHMANTILTVANVLWFFAASIIVYKLESKLNTKPEFACNEGLYWFAFWYITSFYIVLAIVLIGVVMFMFSGRLVGWLFKKWDAQQAQNN